MGTSHHSADDSALVRAARAGDREAASALIERHFGLVFAIARARVRDPEVAEDLAQEVFLRAHLHLDECRGGQRFAAWVGRIARNLAIDWLRTGRRRSQLVPMVPLSEEIVQVSGAHERGARETMAADEERAALRGAMEELPPEQREVVLLHFGEEMTQREIAHRLGVHQATVSRQIRRALANLRGVLEPALRAEARATRAPAHAAARTASLVAAVAAMSSAARSGLVAAAAVGRLGAAGGAVATLLSGGGGVMIGKAAAALSAVAIIGIAVTHKLLPEEGGGDTAPVSPPTQPAQPAAQGTVEPETEPPDEETLAVTEPSSEERTSEAATDSPPRRETNIPSEMLAGVPESAWLVWATPDFEAFLTPFGAYLTGHLEEDAGRRTREDMQWLLDAMREEGLNPAGPLVQFNVAPIGVEDLVEGRVTDHGRVVQIADRGVFEAHRDMLVARVVLLGHSCWLYALGTHGSGGPVPAIAAVGRHALVTRTTQEPHLWMSELLAEHPTTGIAEAVSFIPSGSSQAVIDVAEMASWVPDEIVDALAQVGQEPPERIIRQSGGEWILDPLARRHHRRALDLLGRTRPVSALITPSAEAMRLDVEVRLAGLPPDGRGPRTREPLGLTDELPAEAFFAITCNSRGGQGVGLFRTLNQELVRVLTVDDSEAERAMIPFGLEALSAGDRDCELAVALYPSPFSDVYPRRVVLVRGAPLMERLPTPLPADGGIEVMVDETLTLEGRAVRHVAFGGQSLEEPRDLSDSAAVHRSVPIAMFGPPGEVHHWAAQVGDLFISTTEPQPELLGRMLRGEAEGLERSDLVEPALEGADMALFLRWSRFIGWQGDIEATAGDPQSRARTHERVSESLSAYEQPLWVGVTIRGGGFDLSTVWPAIDFLRLSRDIFD